MAGSALPWEHFSGPEEVVVPLGRMMRTNDLLLVKGDRNEKMYLFTEGLRTLAAEGGDGGGR